MILLDTHAWVWWVGRTSKLSKPAARAIKKATHVGISAITLWEVASLEDAGRLRFDRALHAWLAAACDETEVVALSSAIAIRSTHLSPNFHKDPADRLIVATAVELDIQLVTADEKIHGYSGVRWVW